MAGLIFGFLFFVFIIAILRPNKCKRCGDRYCRADWSLTEFYCLNCGNIQDKERP